MEYSNLFVCLMGIGTVFFGLICLIALTYMMSGVCRSTGAKSELPAGGAAPVPVTTPSSGPDPQMIAAISAALAEEMGTDISGIRIVSIKRL